MRTKLLRLSYPALATTASMLWLPAFNCAAAWRMRRSRNTVMGDLPTILEKRAMKAERLMNALSAKLSIVWLAPGLPTIIEKTRATFGSLKRAKRSTQVLIDVRE